MTLAGRNAGLGGSDLRRIEYEDVIEGIALPGHDHFAGERRVGARRRRSRRVAFRSSEVRNRMPLAGQSASHLNGLNTRRLEFDDVGERGLDDFRVISISCGGIPRAADPATDQREQLAELADCNLCLRQCPGKLDKREVLPWVAHQRRQRAGTQSPGTEVLGPDHLTSLDHNGADSLRAVGKSHSDCLAAEREHAENIGKRERLERST